MARPSKLTPAQWSEVERRLLSGEGARALGREFGVSEGAIRQRFGTTTRVSTQSAQVQETAQKIADANLALEALPIAQRPIAMDLAELLRSTSLSLGRAAELGAKNSHRLQHLANTELQKVDDATPLSDEKSMVALKNVAALTKMANDAAATPINLLAANKDRLKEDPPDPNAAPTSGVLVVPGLAADSASWAAQGGK
jgi:hypothetical protein